MVLTQHTNADTPASCEENVEFEFYLPSLTMHKAIQETFLTEKGKDLIIVLNLRALQVFISFLNSECLLGTRARLLKFMLGSPKKHS